MGETLGFGMKCVKCFLLLLNFTFLIIGIFTVSVGTIILINYNNFDILLESHHLKPAQFIIAVGVLTIATCFIGCLGTSKESTLVVNIYALLLFLLLLLEVSLSIVALIFRCDIYDSLGDNLTNAMDQYNIKPSTKDAWDAIQEGLHCCGVNNPHDWAPYKVPGHLVVHGNPSYTIPFSCCKDLLCKTTYIKGCLHVLRNYTYQSTTIFLYVSVGNVIVKIFAIVLARMLAKAIRRIKSEREMERQINMQREVEQAMTTVDTFGNRIPRYNTEDTDNVIRI